MEHTLKPDEEAQGVVSRPAMTALSMLPVPRRLKMLALEACKMRRMGKRYYLEST